MGDEKLKIRGRDSFVVKAWVGDVTAFSKVLEICSDLSADAVRRAQPLVTAVGTHEKAEYLEQWSFLDEDEALSRWESEIQSKREELSVALRVRLDATLGRFESEISGDPENVVNALDLDDLRKISINVGNLYSSYNSGGYGLSVSFSRTDGVSMKASAPDSDWIVLAREKLIVPLRGRRPWYWVLRAYPVALIGSFLALLGLLISIMLSLSITERSVLSFIFATGVATCVPAAFGLANLIRYLLPAFELLPLGSRAKGGRVVSGALAVIAWASGIALPIILATSTR